jgi:hypothetical protein
MNNEKIEIVIEENNDNFGHYNIVSKANIVFDDYYIDNDDDITNTPIQIDSIPIDKQKIINDALESKMINPIDNNFKLYRYHLERCVF